MLFTLIKKSFKATIENPAVTLFLVLFLIISNFIAAGIITVTTKIAASILTLCLFALIAGFLAGWFQVIKESFDTEKIREKKYLSVFLEGVGKNIIPISIGLIIYSVLSFIVALLAGEIAQKIFGSMDTIIKGAISANVQNINFAQYLNSLSVDDKYLIYACQMSIILGFLILNFIFLFYFPSILDEKKHNMFLKPFVAIWNMLKFTFRNFFSALGFYIFINFAYGVVICIRALIGMNMILSVVFLFLYIYFISCIVMLIFNYYEQKNNCYNGADSIGQDRICDKSGEEN